MGSISSLRWRRVKIYVVNCMSVTVSFQHQYKLFILLPKNLFTTRSSRLAAETKLNLINMSKLSDKLSLYQVNLFQLSNSRWQHVSLVMELVPLHCFLQTDCRIIVGSIFHLSVFARETIVVTEDKSVTWMNRFAFRRRNQRWIDWFVNYRFDW